ncbi:MAG: YkgJ family cysteine cluster protein [Gemmatimonadales bacterium]
MNRYPGLLADLDAWFREGVAAAGPGVVPCTTGCTACCHGPFDISPADAALVAEGVRQLAPDARATIVARAEEQLERYRDVLPEWQRPWDVTALGEEQFDLLSEALAELPCPALDAAGACGIYAHRPATCRLMGLSLITPEGDLLENACPIQADFPSYESLAPTPFDLLRFEYEAEEVDEVVTAAGWCVTTIAAAIVR